MLGIHMPLHLLYVVSLIWTFVVELEVTIRLWWACRWFDRYNYSDFAFTIEVYSFCTKVTRFQKRQRRLNQHKKTLESCIQHSMQANILLKYSGYNLSMEVVGTTTKPVAPRSHMISCYKKCYICTLIVYSFPLQQLISGHYQICANDISPLSLIG